MESESETSDAPVPPALFDTYSSTIERLHERLGKFDCPTNFDDYVKREAKPLVWYSDDSVYVGEWNTEIN